MFSMESVTGMCDESEQLPSTSRGLAFNVQPPDRQPILVFIPITVRETVSTVIQLCCIGAWDKRSDSFERNANCALTSLPSSSSIWTQPWKYKPCLQTTHRRFSIDFLMGRGWRLHFAFSCHPSLSSSVFHFNLNLLCRGLSSHITLFGFYNDDDGDDGALLTAADDLPALMFRASLVAFFAHILQNWIKP